MTTAAHRLTMGLGTALLAAAAVVGCEKTDSTTATPPNTGTGMTGVFSGASVTGPNDPGIGAASPTNPGAGGAPTFGEPTGTGFPSGDAAHASGQGSGLMGFHGTGSYGTSAAISDQHPAGAPPKDAPAWVLPEQ